MKNLLFKRLNMQKRTVVHIFVVAMIIATSITATFGAAQAASGGGLRIVVATPLGNREILNADGLLRETVDNQWRANLDKLNGKINEQVRQVNGKIREVNSQLSHNGEFYVSQDGNALLLRYRVPNNSVYVRVHTPWPLPDVRTTIGYDLDLNLTLSLDGLPNSLQVTQATVNVYNSSFEKKGFALSIVNFFKPSALSKVLNQINGREIDLTSQINQALSGRISQYLSQIPPGVVGAQANVDAAGNITIILGTPAAVIPGNNDATQCHDAVQGKIAWDYSGDTSWNETNVVNLCAGNESSIQPARCFDQVMHGGINWGGGTQWQWENALNLCQGTTNADATIGCFQSEIQQGQSWPNAIAACKR